MTFDAAYHEPPERAPHGDRAPGHGGVRRDASPDPAGGDEAPEVTPDVLVYSADVRGRILILDDELDTCELLERGLSRRGYATESTRTLTDAWRRIDEGGAFDLVVTDLDLGDESGLDLCARVVDRHPHLPVIVLTGQRTMEAAIGAIRAGASDFVTKPVDFDELQHRIDRALRQRELELEVRRLRRKVEQAPGLVNMIGESPPMRRVFQRIDRVAQTDVRVLITGESGVGKELVARAIHDQGAHADGPFVAINCAAVPASLLESELFGHVRGAFTDARRGRDGLFLQAHGGTLFLDEIGEMPAEMQPKLLRALQERTIRPVGGDRDIPFDARVIAATNRDLEEEVERGRFREDLYYRVNVVGVHVPPLRARGTDILLLAQHFLARCAERNGAGVKGISPQAAEKLLAYDWPGNVRELENSMERAVALTMLDEIAVEDLPEKIRAHESTDFVVAAEDPAELLSLAELETRYIRRVLKAVKGNKTQAAAILGLARRTLYRKLDRIELAPETDG